MSTANLFALNGKIAVVTGGCGKLGPVWTQALLDAGATVVVLDLPGAKPPEQPGVHFFTADVTKKESIQAAHDAIVKELGPVDILVNNAGIDSPPAVNKVSYELADIPADILRGIFEVNIIGAFLCMQVFGKDMIAKKSGSIINIGSLYASVSADQRFYNHIDMSPPFLKPPGYGASKAALHNLTKYFATHWGPHNIRVNLLSPGGIEGGQDPEFKRKFCDRVPLARMGQKTDLPGPLLFLASDASQYVTGENIKVDGGFTAW